MSDALARRYEAYVSLENSSKERITSITPVSLLSMKSECFIRIVPTLPVFQHTVRGKILEG